MIMLDLNKTIFFSTHAKRTAISQQGNDFKKLSSSELTTSTQNRTQRSKTVIATFSTENFICEQKKQQKPQPNFPTTVLAGKKLGVWLYTKGRPNDCRIHSLPCVVLQSRPPTNSFLQWEHRAVLGCYRKLFHLI